MRTCVRSLMVTSYYIIGRGKWDLYLILVILLCDFYVYDKIKLDSSAKYQHYKNALKQYYQYENDICMEKIK